MTAAFVVAPPDGPEYPAPDSVEWCDLVLANATRRRVMAREQCDARTVSILDDVINGVLDKRLLLAPPAPATR